MTRLEQVIAEARLERQQQQEQAKREAAREEAAVLHGVAVEADRLIAEIGNGEEFYELVRTHELKGLSECHIYRFNVGTASPELAVAIQWATGINASYVPEGEDVFGLPTAPHIWLRW